MTKTVFIEGMTCHNCVRHVEEALRELDGVKSAKVDLTAKTATIELAHDLTDEMIKTAVEGVGYEVAKIQ
ncbi:MAG: heavy metal-associated domain-containing protein [Peptococcia bacterium]